MDREIQYQLWVLLDNETWLMAGFFDTKEEANGYHYTRFLATETGGRRWMPCKIVRVNVAVEWPL